MQQLDGPRLEPRGTTPTSLVVLLHGYGANGDDLIALGDGWRRWLPDTVFVAPNAPEAIPAEDSGPVRVNSSQLWYRAMFGKVKPIIRNGKQVGTIERPDNVAALKLYDRFERNCRNADRRRARRDGSGR